MSSKNKSQLRTENSNNFPNNNTGFITPEKLRSFNGDMIDSMLISSDSGSFVTTSSFDNGTRDLTFTKADGSTYVNNIPDATVETGSLLTTASISDATITFTKGDASQFSIEVNNVSASIQAEDLVITVKNVSGVTLPAGTAVKATGVVGENITIVSASADNPSLMPAIGVLNEQLTNNSTGECYIAGRLENIDTSNLVAGAAVYVNNNGGLTATKPTGSELIQNIGIAAKINATEGELVIQGSGRSNDLPNITEGYLWVGNNNGVPEAISTGSFVKELETGSFARTDIGNTFNGNQIISGTLAVADTSSQAVTITSGPGDTSPVFIEGGPNFINKFTDSRIRGITIYGGNKISGSWGGVGYGPGGLGSSGVAGIYNNYTSSQAAVVIRHNTTNYEPGYDAYTSFPTQFNQESKLLLKGTEVTISASTGSKQTSVDIQGSVSSSIAKSNVIVNPQTITDDVTIGENSNALVVGDVTFAGSVTIGSGSELTIFDEPNLGGLIETASISGQTLTFTKQDTSTFDVQIPAQSFDTGSFAITGSNTFIGNQIVSGSLTAYDGLETGQPSQYPAGKGDLGVYGQLILRSGSGIVTDGSFGSSVPFDNSVSFFGGISLQQTDISNVKYLEFNQEDPLPSVGAPGGRLAASGSAGNVNLYWSNGTTWTKLN